MTTTYKVSVELSVTEGVFQVRMNPERLYLDGSDSNTIIWEPRPGTIFASAGDVQFVDAGDRFDPVLNGDGTISTTVKGIEAVEKVYVYFLTLRNSAMPQVAVKVDPEVDNPPPPPTGP